MSETDERIRKAAAELSAALTEGGRDYYVSATSIEVTSLESTHREFAYTVQVEETSRRVVAP